MITKCRICGQELNLEKLLEELQGRHKPCDVIAKERAFKQMEEKYPGFKREMIIKDEESE